MYRLLPAVSVQCRSKLRHFLFKSGCRATRTGLEALHIVASQVLKYIGGSQGW